jgi:hypothetical protein
MESEECTTISPLGKLMMEILCCVIQTRGSATGAAKAVQWWVLSGSDGVWAMNKANDKFNGNHEAHHEDIM